MKWPVVSLPDGSLHKLVRTSSYDMNNMKCHDVTGIPIYWCGDDVWPKPEEGLVIEHIEVA